MANLQLPLNQNHESKQYFLDIFGEIPLGTCLFLQPFWVPNIALVTWTLWANGTQAFIVQIPMKATMSFVAEQKYINTAVPKRTKSSNQKFKSKDLAFLLY